MLLKATERNWGLIGPGTWEKRTWKINSDGTYTLTMSETNSGRQAYCIVTDKYGNTVKSNTVTLTVK